MNKNAYFSDLTTYTHQIAPYVLDGVFNVGWRDPDMNSPHHDLPANFVDRLIGIASCTGDFNGLVEPIRELPYCSICGEVAVRNLNGKLILNAELWIPRNGIIYASPILIIHLIAEHSYCPPQEFISAVLEWCPDIKFNADYIYREKLKESGWFADRLKINQ